MLSPQELYSSLKAAVADRGMTAFETVVKIAQSDRDPFVLSPSMLALVFWNEKGLSKIKDLAISDTGTKYKSAAFKIFSAIAGGIEVTSGLLFLHDEEFRLSVNTHIESVDLREIARRQLSELILSLPTDDLLIPIGTAFTQISLASSDSAAELVQALSAKWLRFGPRTLDAYREMLSSEATNEVEFQRFFEDYPQFLDPMAVEVWSQPDFHGAYEPDFVVRRADNSYLVVEIECPAKMIMTQAGQLSAVATHAEKQAVDYKNFLTERISEARAHFPDFRSPDCMAVIGLEGGLDSNLSRALDYVNAARHNVRIVGFDWLAHRAGVILSNVSAAKIKVIKGHRVI